MLPSSGRETSGRALVLNVPVLVLLPSRSRDSFCPPGKAVLKTSKELASEGRPSFGSLTAEEQEKEQEKVGWMEVFIITACFTTKVV